MYTLCLPVARDGTCLSKLRENITPETFPQEARRIDSRHVSDSKQGNTGIFDSKLKKSKSCSRIQLNEKQEEKKTFFFPGVDGADKKHGGKEGGRVENNTRNTTPKRTLDDKEIDYDVQAARRKHMDQVCEKSNREKNIS